MKKARLLDPFIVLSIIACPIFVGTLYFLNGSNNIFWFKENPFLFLRLTISSAVIEEIIFRGVLYELFSKTKLKDRSFKKITYINLLISFIFCLVHLFTHPIHWALATFIPSLIFGQYKERFNSILPPILLHFFYNFCYFLIF